MFCNHHDTEIFKQIETNTIEYDDRRTQLTFFLRSLASEIRRKEINLDSIKAMSNLDPNNQLYPLQIGTEASLNDINFYLEKLLKSVVGVESNFHVLHETYSYLPICIGTIYPYYSTSQLKLLNRILSPNPFEAIFLNVFPSSSHLHIIVGCLVDHFETCKNELRSWMNLDFTSLTEKLSDLIVKKSENWAMSCDIYNKISKDNIKRWEAELANMREDVHETRRMNFSLFDFLP